jgi:hypothetical protein
MPRRKSPGTINEALSELDRIEALINQGVSPEDLSLLQNLPISPNLTLEQLQAERDRERELACRELDEMAKLFARQTVERKKLWGNKFPRVLGQKPPEPSKTEKPFNPVKAGKTKKRRKGQK